MRWGGLDGNIGGAQEVAWIWRGRATRCGVFDVDYTRSGSKEWSCLDRRDRKDWKEPSCKVQVWIVFASLPQYHWYGRLSVSLQSKLIRYANASPLL